MAQSNAVEKQPSMEDILTSIRRIIDDGKAPEETTNVPSVEDVANDVAPVEAFVEQKPSFVEDMPAAAENDIPELDSFLESLDAKFQAQQDAPASTESLASIADEVVEAEEPAVTDVSVEAEPVDASIPEIDEAISAVEATAMAQREANKYEARFSDDDRSAFAAVGSALTNAAPEPAQKAPLVSSRAQASVGQSLGQLTETLADEARAQLPEMTEAMLKPMLSDWLDNNLPSMVERLVRAEIERIARGD